MIIGVSYHVGDSQEHKYFEQYFEHFEDVVKFITESLDVLGREYFHYELSVSFGKEEERIRKILEKTEEE